MFASDPDVLERLREARRNPALAVLEGLHAVKHAVRFGATIERIVVADRARVLRLADRVAPDVVAAIEDQADEVGDEAFATLSPAPVRTGVIAVAQRPVGIVLRGGAPVVLLEDPQDLGNVGACVRVAAAVGAGGVVVTGDKDPWGPGALRGSAGLHFAVPVLRGDAPPDRPLVAFDPDGDPFDPRTLPRDAVLAFGTERDGLSERLTERADAVVSLPMEPGVSSLNLATSVSAALYAWRLARG